MAIDKILIDSKLKRCRENLQKLSLKLNDLPE